MKFLVYLFSTEYKGPWFIDYQEEVDEKGEKHLEHKMYFFKTMFRRYYVYRLERWPNGLVK